jgi:hypothetical protein
MTEHVCIPYGWLSTIPVASGRIASIGGVSLGIFRLPTDPIALVTLIFDGVNADSEIRIYRNSTGEELAGIESCAANQALTVPYFGDGQVTTVRIINAAYEILEFQYTVPSVDQKIPIQKRPDRWYKNPT